MRLFIAVNFPDKTRNGIFISFRELIRIFPNVTLIKKENIHLTLKFLGYIKDSDNSLLSEIKKSIRNSLKEISQLEIEFDQVGFFDRNELIIWLGIKKNPHLVNLARKLDQQMGKLGFSVESRMFSPHVTIGRGKRLEDKEKNEVKDFIDNATTILPSQFSVSYISLMQSVLTTNGPIYSEIERFDITN